MWMETLYVIVYPQDISLELNLYGHHERRSDTLIGTKRYPVMDIINHEELTSVSSRIGKGGKDKAELLFDLTFYPVLQTSDITSDTSRKLLRPSSEEGFNMTQKLGFSPLPCTRHPTSTRTLIAT